LFDMVETVAAAPDWSLDLVGPVAQADRDRLEARIGQPDLAGRVRLHGRQPPAEAWQLTKGAWASLAMLQPTPAFVEAMPSKIYEYLASGLPVLSTRLPRQTKVIEESGGGVLVDSVRRRPRRCGAGPRTPVSWRNCATTRLSGRRGTCPRPRRTTNWPTRFSTC